MLSIATIKTRTVTLRTHAHEHRLCPSSRFCLATPTTNYSETIVYCTMKKKRGMYYNVESKKELASGTTMHKAMNLATNLGIMLRNRSGSSKNKVVLQFMLSAIKRT